MLGNPQGLWLLALLVPLLLLYVLKVRRQRVRVSSTWLWQAAARDLLAKSPWQRLRSRLLLPIEALALAAAALALSRPSLRGHELDAEHVALVIDASASMLGPAAGQPRHEAARAAAERVLAAMPPGADVLLIEAGAEPRVAAPADRDLARVRSRLRGIRPSGVEGNLERAVAMASEQLAQKHGNRRIVVISDDGGLRAGLPRTRVPVSVVKVGEASDNSAIVRLEVGRSEQGRGRADRVEVFADLRHFGRAPRDVFVTLTQRNSPTVLASRRLRLEPGQKTPVVLGFDAAASDAGMGLVVELSPPDALAVDDRAYGRVPPSRKLTAVMAPARSSPWLERALLADPDLELLGAPLAELRAQSIPQDAFLIVSGACPAELPGGDFVIVNPPPGPCRGAVVGSELTAPAITSWERSDPRLRFVTLDGVTVAKARAVDPLSPQNALIRSREGVLLADISDGSRTGTLIGFDVGESSWPLRASFVLFVRNLTEIARAHRRSHVIGPSRTGLPLRVRVPSGVASVRLLDPQDQQTELEARSGIVMVPNPREPGFYVVSYEGTPGGSALSVVNLVSEQESDLLSTAASSPPAAAPAAPASPSPAIDAATDWSFVIAALALSAITFQVGWLTRKPRPVESRRIAARPPPREAGA